MDESNQPGILPNSTDGERKAIMGTPDDGPRPLAKKTYDDVVRLLVKHVRHLSHKLHKTTRAMRALKKNLKEGGEGNVNEHRHHHHPKKISGLKFVHTSTDFLSLIKPIRSFC